LHILILEDDDDFAEIASVVCRKVFPTAEIYVTDNGLDAIEAFTTYKPEITLLDQEVRGKLSGSDVAEEIRKGNVFTRCVSISGHSSMAKHVPRLWGAYVGKRIDELEHLLLKYQGQGLTDHREAV